MRTRLSILMNRLVSKQLESPVAGAIRSVEEDWVPLKPHEEELFRKLTKASLPDVPKDTLTRLRNRIASEGEFETGISRTLNQQTRAIREVFEDRGRPTAPRGFWPEQAGVLENKLSNLLTDQTEEGLRIAMRTVKGHGITLTDELQDNLRGYLGGWAEERAADVSDGIVRTSMLRARSIWGDAVGEDLEDEEASRQSGAMLQAGRGEAISRTEVAFAHEEAANTVWAAAGAVGKRWRTFEDGDTCKICIPLNGEIVKLSEDFEVEVWAGPYPPSHVNCRCITEPVFEDELE